MLLLNRLSNFESSEAQKEGEREREREKRVALYNLFFPLSVHPSRSHVAHERGEGAGAGWGCPCFNSSILIWFWFLYHPPPRVKGGGGFCRF